MKSVSKKRNFFFVFLPLFLGLSGGATAQTNLSNSPGYQSAAPRIAVDPVGNIHVVWGEFYTSPPPWGSNPTGDAFYSKYDIGTQRWSSPLNLSNSGLVCEEEWFVVDIDSDTSGNIYVAYISGYQVWLRILSGGSWSAPFQVGSNSSAIDCVRIAADAQGNLFICWWEIGPGTVYSRAQVRGVWENVQQISPWGARSKFPDIALGTSGAGCTWMGVADGTYHVMVTVRPLSFGANWSTPARATRSANQEQAPAGAIDGNDTAHIVYTPIDNDDIRHVEYTFWTGSSFSAPQDIGSEGMLHLPAIHERGNNIYVTWQVAGGVHYNNRINGYWTGEGIVPNSSGVYYDTDVATSPSQDKVYYVWESGYRTTSEIFFTSIQGPRISGPFIKLSRSKLDFGSTIGGIPTQSQDFMISNSGTGTLSWTATDDAGWLSCAPGSGTGSGQVTVTANASGLGAGTYRATISVSSADSVNSPQTVSVTLTVFATGGGSGPFGVFETPMDGTTGIEGSVPVTGWALDDIEVTKVEIWRDPVTGDPMNSGPVYVGEAVFVEGARPDIEAAYSTYPLNSRAGWGYMMLTNFLPNSGNGTFRIHAIAHDKEGHSALVGSKTISCDNAHATLPFGAIDTPAQGGAWNGTQVSFGWALTPQPKSIPTDGSTILLWIDGQAVGHPTYNNYRADIATLFPGFANSNGAVGYYSVDTTQYANGVHTMAWSVADSAGKASGIGSRYFAVVNSATGSAADLGEISPLSLTSQSNNYYDAPIADQANTPTDYLSPVHVKRGYNPEALAEAVFPDAHGVINIDAQEVGRIEIALSENPTSEGLMERTRDGKKPGGVSANTDEKTLLQDRDHSGRMGDHNYVGYLVVGNELRPLPTGSTLDPVSGVFSWQPGPGFVGEYNFVYISQGGTSSESKKSIRVRIFPAFQLKK
jgi:hypothetical protein